MNTIIDRPIPAPGDAAVEAAQIVAGRFDTLEHAERASEYLVADGVLPQDISIFWLNAPGQHSITPIGGDHIADPAAKPATGGVIAGAAGGGALGAIAGAVGVAATGVDPALGVAVAAGIGAHVGGLVGALSGMKDRDGSTEAGETAEALKPGQKPSADVPDAEADVPSEPRKAGARVAVRVRDVSEQRLIDILVGAGGEDVEEAVGYWKDGEWIDFDPRDPPNKVASTAPRSPA
ncbi:MAG: hypothetical protein K2Y35_20235 [Burkholderiales bacterium]|nr:hypothetical protein [Burkholderiales bacterium]